MQNFQCDKVALYKITGRKIIVAAIIAVMPQLSMAEELLPETSVKETSAKETGVEQLPEVKVSADQEKTNGVVNGYVAKRAKTATKTDTPIIETPQSISVITSDQMRDQNVQSIQDALRYSAGVVADQYGLDSRSDNISIRGMDGTQYLDGLRQINTYYQDIARPDPFTLERIEILRGPSSMLFGSGGVGGVVNLGTKRPQEAAQNEIGVSIGNYDSKRIQADFTGPVADTDNLFYRLVFVGRDNGTQVDHTEDKRVIVAPSLTWKNDKTTVTLLAQIQRNEVNSTNQFLPISGILTPNPNGKIKHDTFIGDPDTDKYNTDSTSFSWLIDHQFNDTFSVHQNARYNSSKNTYNVLYGNVFAADPFVPGTNQRVINRYVDFSKIDTKKFNIDNNLQAKFSTDRTTHTALFGVDYSRFKQDRKGFGDAGLGNPIDVFNPVYTPVDYSGVASYQNPTAYQFQTGVYLQDQIKFDQHWVATLGLRHDRASSKSDGSPAIVDKKTTGRYGLTYLFDNGWAPYVSYAESFQPVAGTDRSGKVFKPQEGEQYELGVKYMPEGSKTKFTAAIFDLTDKNRLTPDPSGGPFDSIQKAEVRSRGLELEAATSFDNRLDLIASYSYTNAKYNKSNVLTEKGNQIEAVPKHLATVWAIKHFAIGDIDGFRAGLGVRYIGESYDSTATFKTPDVTLFDAMLGFDRGAWRYALNASNLTDKEYVATCLSRGDCWLGPKRVATATATYNF